MMLEKIAKTLFHLRKSKLERSLSADLQQLLDGECITLVDVGSAGGVEPRWKPYRRHINYIGIEPKYKEQYKYIIDSGKYTALDCLLTIILGEYKVYKQQFKKTEKEFKENIAENPSICERCRYGYK